MGRLQGLGDLAPDAHRLAELERPAPKPVLQRLPLQVLHHQKERCGLLRPDIEEGAHVRVLQLRKRLRLAFEAKAVDLVPRELRRQYLHRHRPSQAGVGRPVHFSHTALPEQRFDLVGAQATPDGQTQSDGILASQARTGFVPKFSGRSP